MSKMIYKWGGKVLYQLVLGLKAAATAVACCCSSSSSSSSVLPSSTSGSTYASSYGFTNPGTEQDGCCCWPSPASVPTYMMVTLTSSWAGICTAPQSVLVSKTAACSWDNGGGDPYVTVSKSASQCRWSVYFIDTPGDCCGGVKDSFCPYGNYVGVAGSDTCGLTVS